MLHAGAQPPRSGSPRPYHTYQHQGRQARDTRQRELHNHLRWRQVRPVQNIVGVLAGRRMCAPRTAGTPGGRTSELAATATRRKMKPSIQHKQPQREPPREPCGHCQGCHLQRRACEARSLRGRGVQLQSGRAPYLQHQGCRCMRGQLESSTARSRLPRRQGGIVHPPDVSGRGVKLAPTFSAPWSSAGTAPVCQKHGCTSRAGQMSGTG